MFWRRWRENRRLLQQVRDSQVTLLLRTATIIRNQEGIMVDFTKLTTEVEELTSVQEGAVKLLSTLAQEIRDLKNAGEMDPAVQMKIDDLAGRLDTTTNSLAAAVEANTPAAPAPPVEPTPEPIPEPAPEEFSSRSSNKRK